MNKQKIRKSLKTFIKKNKFKINTIIISFFLTLFYWFISMGIHDILPFRFYFALFLIIIIYYTFARYDLKEKKGDTPQ